MNAHNPQSTDFQGHHQEAMEFYKSRKHLTKWETNFLKGIMGFKKLSPEQSETLDGIRRKVVLSQGGVSLVKYCKNSYLGEN